LVKEPKVPLADEPTTAGVQLTAQQPEINLVRVSELVDQDRSACIQACATAMGSGHL
jgi:methylmalonyl-CoA mutase N-terminal domain/subunit